MKVIEKLITIHFSPTTFLFPSFFYLSPHPFLPFFLHHSLSTYYVAGTILRDTKMNITDLVSQSGRKDM